jgi:hypothetical protein
MFMAIFEGELGDAGFVEVADAFIAMHSAPVALRQGILYIRVLQPALHYEPEQISKSEILRKLKQRFGGKTIRDLGSASAGFGKICGANKPGADQATFKKEKEVVRRSEKFAD